jgi:hypothetical protein
MLRNCDVCQTAYTAKRENSRFCSDRCRNRARDIPNAVVKTVAPVVSIAPIAEGSLLSATLAELVAAERVNSSLGQAALLLARRLDAIESDSGSSVAALVREHRVALAEAVKDATALVDPLDQLAARRAERIAVG